MPQVVVDRERLKLEDDRKLLSPPRVVPPLYRCATSVTVVGFVPHADLDVEVDGAVVVTLAAGWPEPDGETVALPAPLAAGQTVRVRQHSGGFDSAWSPALTVRDHTEDYPAGPPRPEMGPLPLYDCGARTGVGNLLGGGNVWVTADAVEVGRVDGCSAPRQGVDVNWS